MQTLRAFCLTCLALKWLLILKLCDLSLFYYAFDMQNIYPFKQVFNKGKDKNIVGLP